MATTTQSHNISVLFHKAGNDFHTMETTLMLLSDNRPNHTKFWLLCQPHATSCLSTFSVIYITGRDEAFKLWLAYGIIKPDYWGLVWSMWGPNAGARSENTTSWQTCEELCLSEKHKWLINFTKKQQLLLIKNKVQIQIQKVTLPSKCQAMQT